MHETAEVLTERVSPSANTQHLDARSLFERLFRFSAPYLEEKLLEKHVVGSHDEFEECFAELKKFFALTTTAAGVPIGMISDQIDQVWHNFILFTREYHAFCQHYFGRYLHHRPDLAASPVPPEGLQNFIALYRENFGALPSVWGLKFSPAGAGAEVGPEHAGADCMGCTHCMGCSMSGCMGCMA